METGSEGFRNFMVGICAFKIEQPSIFQYGHRGFAFIPQEEGCWLRRPFRLSFLQRAVPLDNCALARHRFPPAMAERAERLFGEATTPRARCSPRSGRNSRVLCRGLEESHPGDVPPHPWSYEARRESAWGSVRVQMATANPGRWGFHRPPAFDAVLPP